MSIDVIWKRELYLRTFAKMYFDYFLPSDTKVNIDSGGECNSANFTFLHTQHILSVSFLNLKAL